MADKSKAQKKSKDENATKGYWEEHLGKYLAYPMAIYAALAIGALFFKAALWLIGNPVYSVIPAIIAGLGAGNISFGYFCQDGYALQKKLRQWGRALDDIKRERGWLNFLRQHKANIAVGLLTLATTLALLIVSVFFPPPFISAFAAITSLNKAGIGILVGGTTFLFCRLLYLIPKGIVEIVTKKSADEPSPDKQKTSIWRKIFYEVLGIILAVAGAIFTTLATFDPLLEVFGSGIAAGILSSAVAGIAGLVYFCRDGESIRKRMLAWSESIKEKVDNFNIREFFNKNKAVLFGLSALSVITIAIISVVVVWQPAPIASALVAMNLDGLTKLGLTAVIGSVIWGCCFVGSLIKGCFSQKGYEVVGDEGKGGSEEEQGEKIEEGDNHKPQSSTSRDMKAIIDQAQEDGADQVRISYQPKEGSYMEVFLPLDKSPQDQPDYLKREWQL